MLRAALRAAEQRLEQYSTVSQLFFHLARQVNGRSQTGQTLVGRCAFLCILADRPITGVGDIKRLLGPKSIPLARESTLWVMLCGLFLDIKLPAPARITANACDVLPVTVVAADVVVDQMLLEEGGTVTPINAKLIHQAAGCNLSPAITHIPSNDQLVHQCIH